VSLGGDVLGVGSGLAGTDREAKRRKAMLNLIKKFVKEEEGATMVEYGLMVALIAVVLIVAVTAVGTNLEGLFNTVATEVGSATTT
jgi:pilus assembly protein Flp/PilA